MAGRAAGTGELGAKRQRTPLRPARRSHAQPSRARLGRAPAAAGMVEILSSPFVVHPTFGTRCSTLVMIGYDGSLYVQERRFDPHGETLGQSGWTLAPGEWPVP